MKIENSTLLLNSRHSLIEIKDKRESFKFWSGDSPPEPQGNSSVPLQPDWTTLSDIAKQRLDKNNTPLSSGLNAAEEINNVDEMVEKDPRLLLIKLLVEQLTGKKVLSIQITPAENCTVACPHISAAMGGQAAAQPEKVGWGLIYNATETITEKEQTAFDAKGIVKTQDGREITVSVSMLMKRQFTKTSSVSIREGDAKKVDPLVINIEGGPVSLSDRKYSFDLNADGKSENIYFVGAGSGFLALDGNGDGRINNGSELFGPATGNGFAELSSYDDDGNLWIDENDPVYNRLLLWSKGSDGSDTLKALKDAGIGAVSLSSVSSRFQLKDTANSLGGEIKSSGVYLKESGRAGSIQQIDLSA